MLAAEAFLGVGVLGVGGIVALAAGSFFLFDPAAIGVGLPASLIVITSGVLGSAMLTLAFIAFRTRKRGAAIAEVALIGHIGEVASLESPSARKGMAFVGGETWKFVSNRDVAVGDKVKVVSHEEGLLVRVEPANNSNGR
jgi:membrane-bound serine protease (ClpP class)